MMSIAVWKGGWMGVILSHRLSLAKNHYTQGTEKMMEKGMIILSIIWRCAPMGKLDRLMYVNMWILRISQTTMWDCTMKVLRNEGATFTATDEELRKVYNIFSDAWKFCRKYADIRQEDERWSTLIDDSEIIAKKHSNSRLCRDLIIAAVDELERNASQS